GRLLRKRHELAAAGQELADGLGPQPGDDETRQGNEEGEKGGGTDVRVRSEPLEEARRGKTRPHPGLAEGTETAEFPAALPGCEFEPGLVHFGWAGRLLLGDPKALGVGGGLLPGTDAGRLVAGLRRLPLGLYRRLGNLDLRPAEGAGPSAGPPGLEPPTTPGPLRRHAPAPRPPGARYAPREGRVDGLRRLGRARIAAGAALDAHAVEGAPHEEERHEEEDAGEHERQRT